MNTNQRRLIITADDYGMCEFVNIAIEECLAAEAVLAACVMANMPVYRAAGSLRRKFPQRSFGLHWNITQGWPVLPSARVSTLVNGDGSFFKSAEFKCRWWTGRVKLNELKAELRAQFDRLTEIMGPPDFWNTHQNVHVFPGLFYVFADFARDLGIPAMRCHRRITVPLDTSERRYQLSHPRYWLKGQVIAWWSAHAEALGTVMPDARVYALGYVEPRTMVAEVVTRLPWSKVKKAVEIVIHPATAIREDLFGALTQSRIAEYQTFKNSGLAKRLRESGVEPVSFKVLRPPITEQ